jgi:hypothetical protein
VCCSSKKSLSSFRLERPNLSIFANNCMATSSRERKGHSKGSLCLGWALRALELRVELSSAQAAVQIDHPVFHHLRVKLPLLQSTSMTIFLRHTRSRHLQIRRLRILLCIQSTPLLMLLESRLLAVTGTVQRRVALGTRLERLFLRLCFWFGAVCAFSERRVQR